MTYILAIMSVPLLTATGIYDPHVMRKGRCLAEPGSYYALWCPAPPEAPPYRKHRRR
jgi:hypothetical protein